MNFDDLMGKAKGVFKDRWDILDARKVPRPGDILLNGNQGKKFEATVLYADLNESTALVDKYKPEFAAEVYKTFLASACMVIKEQGGEITAFDGDRVMAIFMGSAKNSQSVSAALKIHHVVRELNKVMVAQYPRLIYRMGFTIGIDTSELLTATTGVRADNDLVWVGKAANHAAKLCTLGTNSFPVTITEEVFKVLRSDVKYTDKKPMWVKDIWAAKGRTIYRSGWYWPF